MGGGGGMMQKVMGALNDVVDVNPMNAMHSTGDFLTGYKAPPLMPCEFLKLLLIKMKHFKFHCPFSGPC